MIFPLKVRRLKARLFVSFHIFEQLPFAGSFTGATGGVCDLLENLNIKDNTGDIETALECLKLQVSLTDHHLAVLLAVFVDIINYKHL